MKKSILFGFFFCFTFAAFSQSQRTVLLEEFTQASCPPCETTTPALNAIVAANADKIVQVRYQTSWPGVDPMNADNPGEVQTRVDYYGVTGVPNLRHDGTDTGSPGTITQAQIDGAYDKSSPVLIEVEHTISDDLATMDVTVRIINEGTDAFEDPSDKLRVVLIEEEINWPTPPGSTSLVDFEAVMKTFFTTPEGIDIPEIAAGEMWEMTWTGLEVPSVIYNYNKLAVVAFLQNDATTEVHNAAQSETILLEGYADLGIASASANTSSNLCDYAFDGEVTISNEGGSEVTAYDVILNINEVEQQTINVTDVLAAGASNTVMFETLTLDPGTSIVTFEVVAIGGDIATLNNTSSPVTVGKAGAASSLVQEDFESDAIGSLPANAIVDLPAVPNNGVIANAAFVGGSSPIGGFGESDQAIFVNLWNWNPASFDATGEIVIASQFIVPSVSSLTFDYAFTNWGGSNDRLQAQISTDCGATYTDLFNESGAALATAPPLNQNNAFFVPTADQWSNEQFDLSAYEGEEVLIRFFITSAWGDMMYIDNVNLSNVVNVDDITTTEKLEVYPNPASQDVNIELSIDEPALVSVKVLDLLGRTIFAENVSSNKVSEVNHTINVSNYESGSYLLYITAGDRVIVRNISVVN